MVNNDRWQAYKNIVNSVQDSFNQETVIWKRHVFTKSLYGEEVEGTFQEVELKVLLGFNVFRTWPITRHTESGELDNQNMVMGVNRKYLETNGWLDASGYFKFDPARDRFIHRGIEYKGEGDTLVSQASNDPLHIYVVLLRQEEPTGTTEAFSPPPPSPIASFSYTNNNQANSGANLLDMAPVMDPAGTYSYFLDGNDELPAGVTLDASTGIISFTAGMAGGAYEFDVIAVSSAGSYATARVSVLVTGDVNAEVSTLLLYASGKGYSLPSIPVQEALSAYIDTAKADEWWALEDAEHMLATDGDSDFACLNLVDPTDDYYLRKINSPLFVPLKGFDGENLPTSSLYPNDPLTSYYRSVKYSQDDASVSIYYLINRGSTATNYYALADDFPARITLQLRSTATGQQTRINSGLADAISCIDNGFYQMNRIDANNGSLWINGTEHPLTKSSNTRWGGRLSFKNGPSNNVGDQSLSSFISYGKNQHIHAAAKKAALETYLTTIGAL